MKYHSPWEVDHHDSFVGSPTSDVTLIFVLSNRISPYILLVQDWRTYGTRKDFLGTRHSLLSKYDCVGIEFELSSLPNNTASGSFLLIGRGAKSWQDIYHWGAGLAVTGRICDIGQNVLQSSFQTGSSSSPSYFHSFFLIAFLEEAFIRNIRW
jgi:hypothetical protein